jgi:hypothetical protein
MLKKTVKNMAKPKLLINEHSRSKSGLFSSNSIADKKKITSIGVSAESSNKNLTTINKTIVVTNQSNVITQGDEINRRELTPEIVSLKNKKIIDDGISSYSSVNCRRVNPLLSLAPTETGNTSQIKVMARFRPLNLIEKAIYLIKFRKFQKRILIQ